ncbi:MAG TPA: hypothetical protein VHN15_08750 [Thermoanaerobaculia bacterium]|nr:hypothetical protein [Thermoanaerobaculia bacterium]
MKKKSLRKLSLSRETVRTLADVTPLSIAGGAKPVVPIETMTTCPYHTNCDYTYSCPEVCGPVVQLTDLC